MELRRVPDLIGRERMWWLVSTGTGTLTAVVVRRTVKAAYRALRSDDSPSTPFDPEVTGFSWPDAVLWAAAAGIGLGIAKVVGARVATVGWEVATGTLPPGVGEETSTD